MSHSEGRLPIYIERQLMAEQDKFLDKLSVLIDKHPEYRTHMAYCVLGGAVAICDTFGADADGFIRGLRANFERPACLVPPDRSKS